MAPQPELIVALKPDAQIYNFTAGAYERVFNKVNDCDFIPQPADLKCLDFSINNFSYNSTRLDFSPQGPVRSNLVWKDTTSCSGDLAARINATYGYALDGDVFSQIRPNERTNVIERFQLSFYLKKDLPPKPAVDTRAPPPRPYCTLPYISSSVPYFGNGALLAEKQPTDFTFSYVDNAAFATTATTATTTVAATSTFASSTVATVAKSASASGSGSAAASASVPVVAVPTTAAAATVPTAYVAPANPTAYVAPAVPAYGAPANNNNNNLYKGAAVEKVGVFAALLVAVFLA